MSTLRDKLVDCTLTADGERLIIPNTLVEEMVAVIEAAKPFTDRTTCLDDNCAHYVCVLNKAMEELQ